MRKKRGKARSRTIQHLVIDCLMFVYFAHICMNMYVMLCRKGTVCAREREETITSYILSQWPQVQGSFFFSFFLYAVLSHYRCRFSTKRMHFSLPHIHTYIHTSDAYKKALWVEQKSFLFFSCTHTYIHTEDGEKIAAGRKRRTRLSILRNNDVWARVYTQANVLFLLLT
jgi:hypothetical protein